MPLVPANPEGAAWPGVSMGLAVTGSGLFLTTGHTGTDAQGEPVTTSAEDQVVALFENFKATLASAGLGFEHVAQIKAYLKSFDPDFMSTYRAVRSRYLNQSCPPTSVAVQAGLYDDRLLIEAELVAVIP
ncbi:RidA family protein [Mesorhizobium sp. M2C.T.Ca.TU.009.01.2.1]|nr:RidA family protein [Mesorhizobium sp. M2C.T.Ca.TU.009.01.2.1]